MCPIGYPGGRGCVNVTSFNNPYIVIYALFILLQKYEFVMAIEATTFYIFIEMTNKYNKTWIMSHVIHQSFEYKLSSLFFQ